MEQNVFVEILRPDGTAADTGEPGELVLTDLHNRAMPLIRYRVGDFGAWASPCRCGRPLPSLERIYGREYDFVHGLDGRRFHGEFFLYVFEELQSTGYPVEQFQVVQTDRDRLRVDVISNVPLAADFIVRLRERVEPQMPGMKLDLRPVPAIARASSGKMRLIINEVAAIGRN
jgi:phenylacetate-CoA ligase